MWFRVTNTETNSSINVNKPDMVYMFAEKIMMDPAEAEKAVTWCRKAEPMTRFDDKGFSVEAMHFPYVQRG